MSFSTDTSICTNYYYRLLSSMNRKSKMHFYYKLRDSILLREKKSYFSKLL